MMPLPPTQAGNGNHKETVVLISKAYWGEAVDYEKKKIPAKCMLVAIFL